MTARFDWPTDGLLRARALYVSFSPLKDWPLPGSPQHRGAFLGSFVRVVGCLAWVAVLALFPTREKPVISRLVRDAPSPHVCPSSFYF